MKCQLTEQSLRFRLAQRDFEQLLATQHLALTLDFAGRFQLKIQLSLHTQPQALLRGDSQHWHIYLPVADLLALQARLPSRHGLDFEIPASTDRPGSAIKIMFDVDIHDKLSRPA